MPGSLAMLSKRRRSARGQRWTSPALVRFDARNSSSDAFSSRSSGPRRLAETVSAPRPKLPAVVANSSAAEQVPVDRPIALVLIAHFLRASRALRPAADAACVPELAADPATAELAPEAEAPADELPLAWASTAGLPTTIEPMSVRGMTSRRMGVPSWRKNAGLAGQFAADPRTSAAVNEMKSYGFIQPDEGGKDVFAHISAVERSGMRGLAEGMKVSYEVEADRKSGKESATNLKVA
jgi:cold shock protein